MRGRLWQTRARVSKSVIDNGLAGLTGPALATSFSRWMSMVPACTFLRLATLLEVRAKISASLSSLASGCVDRSSSSTSMSLADSSPLSSSSMSRLRFLLALPVACAAQPGVGYSLWYCFRNRRAYSLPLTMSSSAVSRSFLSRGTDARLTTNRSSSLSSQAGLSSSPSDSAAFAATEPAGAGTGPASKKNRS
jgi:hypothetical protein